MVLRGYQKRAYEAAVTALTGGGGFLLSLEMRTGKTPVSLEVAKHFGVPLLIVCPKIALPVWRAHIEKLEVKKSISEVYLVHYEALVGRKDVWYKWGDRQERRGKGFFMILDESHYIKTKGTDRSRVVRTISRRSKYRLALTGTPIANGLHDAWAQYDYLGKIFGPWEDTWEGGSDGNLVPGFETTYLIRGGFRNHEIIGYRNQERFYEIFHRHQFRITLREAKEEGRKGHMVLKYQKRFFDLTPVSMGIYATLQEELEAIVNEKKIKVPNVLSCVAKLQQICGGYVIEQIPTGRYTAKGKAVFKKEVHRIPGESKINLLLDTIGSLPTGRKLIVICRFIHELEAARKALEDKGFKVGIVRGGMPYDGKFEDDIICMQIQSGQAVDMSKADSIIFYSLDYSYINFEQSRFRILNYDKNFGKYIFLLARNTIDEVIYAAVKTKKRVADLVIDRFRKRLKYHGKSKQTYREPQGQIEIS
jgi:SNF2 family DNA or RNA helicase